jgi:hypothetical protein
LLLRGDPATFWSQQQKKTRKKQAKVAGSEKRRTFVAEI